jgi:hypothetical protein
MEGERSSTDQLIDDTWILIFCYFLSKNGNSAIHIAGQFYHTGALDSIYGRVGNCVRSSVYCLVAYTLIAGGLAIFSKDPSKHGLLFCVAGADTMLEHNKGETVYDYVPNLMKHYKSIYKKLIKDELNYVSTQ